MTTQEEKRVTVTEIINEVNMLYPDIDKNVKANQQMIKDTEWYIGKTLPESYKKFLKYFSNGIFLFDIEPILGVGRRFEDTPCGIVRYSKEVVQLDTPSTIVPENKGISRNKLIAFTAGSAPDMSLDHWVFITDEEPEGHEYKVGYVSQSSGNVVVVLKNFEEWLNIFWQNNKDEDKQVSVFHSLHPTVEERDKILQII